MGCEIGQSAEWNANDQVNWWLLDSGPYHRGVQRFVQDLNSLYQRESSLWDADYSYEGFSWVDCSDAENSVLSFMRRTRDGQNPMLVVLNLTPVPRPFYRLGVPVAGRWLEVLNSDAEAYGGSNQGNLGGVVAEQIPSHGQACSAALHLPPLSVVVFKPENS
jgi:1,4-alpha-glucan branching enzyme